MPIPSFTVIPNTLQPETFSSDMDTWLSEIRAWTDAVNASSSAYMLDLYTSSTTSNSVSVAQKTFTVGAGLGHVPGVAVVVAYTADPTIRMIGTVYTYSGTTLVIDVASIYGTGTYSSWTISPTALPAINFYSPGEYTYTLPPQDSSLGYLNIPLTSKSADYTFVLADAGTGIIHPSADTTGRTFTIPANASVAYPIGTGLVVVNQNGAGAITLACTSDVIRLAGDGTTGNKTISANGVAVALKVTSTEWIVSGTGVV